jgi:4-amino-4-deoxy-L-arabinose transferase-like glycosyltransferase
MKAMAESGPPAATLLVRAGGVRGLVYTALPVTTFAVTNPIAGLRTAIIAAVSVASIILVWQLVRRESVRPAVFGFAGVSVCAAFAFITGRAKDFYLPGIWMYLGLAIAFTVSIVIRRPLVGVGWAWVTGRDGAWRTVPRVRTAFDVATAVMATASWARFLVQNYLYDTNQEGLLAVARIAMGWPIFLVTSSAIYIAVRVAIRALPRASAQTGG